MGKNRLPILGCVVLTAVVLIEGYGYLGLNNLNNVLVKENGELKLQCDELNTRYTQLSISYDTMEQNYEGLQTRYTELDLEHASLQLEYDALEGRCNFWRTKYDKLQNEQAQIGEGNKFAFYYAALAKQRFGVDDLEEYLDRWEWSEGVYAEGVFDCSEMSAYIEWKLENEGYHVYIVYGTAPWGGGNHVWLLVETDVGEYMPVEATTFDLVKWDSPYFDEYFEYDHIFETIQDALTYSYQEFDWWEP